AALPSSTALAADRHLGRRLASFLRNWQRRRQLHLPARRQGLWHTIRRSVLSGPVTNAASDRAGRDQRKQVRRLGRRGSGPLIRSVVSAKRKTTKDDRRRS